MLEKDLQASGIEGAWLLPLKQIETAGGSVLHMLRPDMPLQPGLPAGIRAAADKLLHVGEIYFSEVLPGQVKAWKRHTRQVQHFCVPCGRLGIALYDDRGDSPSRGKLFTTVLGRSDRYALLRIPCGVWYGFTALGTAPALVCNAADIPHDPSEGEKCVPGSGAAAGIPFDWTSTFPA